MSQAMWICLCGAKNKEQNCKKCGRTRNAFSEYRLDILTELFLILGADLSDIEGIYQELEAEKDDPSFIGADFFLSALEKLRVFNLVGDIDDDFDLEEVFHALSFLLTNHEGIKPIVLPEKARKTPKELYGFVALAYIADYLLDEDYRIVSFDEDYTTTFFVLPKSKSSLFVTTLKKYFKLLDLKFKVSCSSPLREASDEYVGKSVFVSISVIYKFVEKYFISPQEAKREYYGKIIEVRGHEVVIQVEASSCEPDDQLVISKSQLHLSKPAEGYTYCIRGKKVCLLFLSPRQDWFFEKLTHPMPLPPFDYIVYQTLTYSDVDIIDVLYKDHLPTQHPDDLIPLDQYSSINTLFYENNWIEVETYRSNQRLLNSFIKALEKEGHYSKD